MKKLSLLFLLLCVAVTSLAGGPSRSYPESEIYGNYLIYQRLDRGSAFVNYTSIVPQDNVFEIVPAWNEQQLPDDYIHVFIKNIVYCSEQEFGDYWLDGYMENGKLYVPLNQDITVETAKGPRLASLAWGTVSYNSATGHATFTRDLSVDMATYTMDDDKIRIDNTSGPIIVDTGDELSFECSGLGIVWEDEDGNYEWTGYLEWGTEISTGIYVIDWQPEGELKIYNRTTDCLRFDGYGLGTRDATYFTHEQLSDKGEIVFSHDGKTVYLKDPMLSMTNGTWIRGTLSDNYIKIYLPQYLNHDVLPACLKWGNSYIQTSSPRPDGTSGDWMSVTGGSTFYKYYYRIEGNTITMDDSWTNFDAPYPENYEAGGISVLTSGNRYAGALEANTVYVLDNDNPEKTSDPIIRGYAIDNGNAYCVEITPTEPSVIYFRVQGPEGNTSLWTRYLDALIFNEPGEYHIEAYAQADGKSSSGHVYHVFNIGPSTGITETSAGKQIVSQRYYNAMGQQVQRPDGMTIIVTTYSDGTTATKKVMK